MCCVFFQIIAIFALLLVVLKAYLKFTTGICRSSVSLIGKTAIVTGSNRGIGYETALDFAKRGARVILACRNQELGDEARRRIINETNNPNIVLKLVDLSSLSSVRKFAQDINATEDRLDILVNNAGVVDRTGKISEDGLSYLLQVNYFGPFLLTNLLLNLLKKSGNSRVVNVSAIIAKRITFKLTDLKNTLASFIKQYAVSQLCTIYFTIELANKLKGSGVTTNSLHPGVVATDITREMPKVLLKLRTFVLRTFCKDAFEGAQTQIYLAVDKSVANISGEHFSDCKLEKRYKAANDPVLPQQIWNLTEEMVQLTDEEKQY